MKAKHKQLTWFLS